MKTLLIGQFKCVRKFELTVQEVLWTAQLTWRRKKIDAMSEISKKRCKASLKTCRCCNSTLKRILDWFGKMAKKENLVEKVKDIGQVEVLQDKEVNVHPTKMCRKSFRKIAKLPKGVHAFRDICLK